MQFVGILHFLFMHTVGFLHLNGSASEQSISLTGHKGHGFVQVLLMQDKPGGQPCASKHMGGQEPDLQDGSEVQIPKIHLLFGSKSEHCLSVLHPM